MKSCSNSSIQGQREAQTRGKEQVKHIKLKNPAWIWKGLFWATKMVKGLEGKACEGRLRALRDCWGVCAGPGVELDDP